MADWTLATDRSKKEKTRSRPRRQVYGVEPLDGAGRSASDADGVRLIEENAMAKKSQRSGRKSAAEGAHDDARAGEDRNNVDGDEKQEASAAK
ncbi:MAG TPA: hypothetical protein VGL96_00775, partial [Casimicrobiaceae bacterium]